jgi:hypothetical protein
VVTNLSTHTHISLHSFLFVAADVSFVIVFSGIFFANYNPHVKNLPSTESTHKEEEYSPSSLFAGGILIGLGLALHRGILSSPLLSSPLISSHLFTLKHFISHLIIYSYHIP